MCCIQKYVKDQIPYLSYNLTPTSSYLYSEISLTLTVVIGEIDVITLSNYMLFMLRLKFYFLFSITFVLKIASNSITVKSKERKTTQYDKTIFFSIGRSQAMILKQRRDVTDNTKYRNLLIFYNMDNLFKIPFK